MSLTFATTVLTPISIITVQDTSFFWKLVLKNQPMTSSKILNSRRTCSLVYITFFSPITFSLLLYRFSLHVFFRYVPLLGFSPPQWQAWNDDLSSKGFYFAQPANEIKHPHRWNKPPWSVKANQRHKHSSHKSVKWLIMHVTCVHWCCNVCSLMLPWQHSSWPLMNLQSAAQLD